MRSRAGRFATASGVRTRLPESFHNSTFGCFRPFGYSGVSATHMRPCASQSMLIGLLISGSEATRLMLKSGCTSSFTAAFSGAVGPPSGYRNDANSNGVQNSSISLRLATHEIPLNNTAR